VSLLLAIGMLSAFRYQTPQAARPPWRAAASTGIEICDAKGSASLCANRQNGSSGIYTYVIGWSAGDPNDTFDWLTLPGMCTNGHVTQNPPCPFAPGGGLNTRYNHATIAELWDYNSGFYPGLCVADDGAGSGATLLNICPDASGNGGANGTIFILPQYPNTTYAVNRYWSDNTFGGDGTQPAWLCVVGRGGPLTEASFSGNAGICQWNTVG
jgi:hypothetical protein